MSQEKKIVYSVGAVLGIIGLILVGWLIYNQGQMAESLQAMQEMEAPIVAPAPLSKPEPEPAPVSEPEPEPVKAPYGYRSPWDENPNGIVFNAGEVISAPAVIQTGYRQGILLWKGEYKMPKSGATWGPKKGHTPEEMMTVEMGHEDRPNWDELVFFPPR